ncbi:MAG: Do family serine endopeptidase [Bacteroidota bacterium]
MKKIAVIVLSAMLGSAFTMGLFQMVDQPEEQVFRVEHYDNLPTVSSRYPGDANMLDFSVPAAEVMPGVVHIKSTQLRPKGNRQNQQIPEAFRDFFGERFFEQGPGQSQPQPNIGSGSGVIVTEVGYIVTNNHVIDGADDVEVVLNDNRSFKAEIVGTDPSTDLALLKIEAPDLVSVQMGNSDEVRVGEWVLAIGNPFNLTSTVTAGIVSAKARNINILRDRAAIESFIQTDAAVNPGNSGGALVNLQGELIGINTAIASPTGSYSGYSFAVPTQLVRKVVQDLIEFGTVQRGYLGVIIRNVDANLSKAEDLKLNDGVYVDSLLDNSAAAAAGIQTGDVIIAVDEQEVTTASELQAAIGAHRPGDQIELTINRDGKERFLPVTLKNQAGTTEVAARPAKDLWNELGLELKELSKTELREMGLKQGVKVSRVFPGKVTRQTDLKEGFVITRIDGKEVGSVAEIEKMLDGKEGGVMLEGQYQAYPGSYYYAFGL